MSEIPPEFIVLNDYAPMLLIDLKYCGNDNLIGRPLKGYPAQGLCLLTKIAADSLVAFHDHVQKPETKAFLKMKQPRILILDAYRPQMGCDDFWDWSRSDCAKTKADYYPNIDKQDMFELGYIARKSSHSRGSTVDLTIIDIEDNHRALDMGTRFDFMDPLSHPDNKDVSNEAYLNRQWLKQCMSDFGWQGIDQEWWHFTFRNEPFPETYFNFPLISA